MESEKKTTDKEGEYRDTGNKSNARSWGSPLGRNGLHHSGPASTEDSEEFLRGCWKRTDDSPLTEYSEGKWLKSDTDRYPYRCELSSPDPDNSISDMVAEQETDKEPPGTDGHQTPPSSADSRSTIGTSEDTILIVWQGLNHGGENGLVEYRDTMVAPYPGSIPPVVKATGPLVPWKQPAEVESALSRRAVVAIFDDTTRSDDASEESRSRNDSPTEAATGRRENEPSANDHGISNGIPPVALAAFQYSVDQGASPATFGDRIRREPALSDQDTSCIPRVETAVQENKISGPVDRSVSHTGKSSDLVSAPYTSLLTLLPYKCAAVQIEKYPLLVYANCDENESQNMVSRRVRTIPMRLLMANLFVGFFLVLITHYELLAAVEERRTISSPGRDRPERPLCRSVLCRAIGTHLFYALNLSAQPCDSIYDVVCRPWIHESPAEYRRIVLGTDMLFVENILSDIRRVLVSRRESRFQKTSLDKVQRLYLLCVNNEERDVRGLADFHKMMRRYKLEVWPFRRYPGSMAENLALFVHDTGSDVFFRLTSTPDGEGADVPTVECPSLGLPAMSFAENTSDVRVYRTYVVNILRELSSSPGIEDMATEIVQFETTLARLVVALCHTDEPYTFRNTTDSDFLRYAFDVNMFVTVAVTLHNQLQKSIIRFQSWDFFSKATSLMEEKRVQSANYFGWRVAARLLPFTTTPIAKLYQQFQAAMGVDLSTRGRHCLREVNDVMPLAMGRLLITEYSRKSASFEAYRLMFQTVRSLDREVHKDRWFDDNTHSMYTSLRATMSVMFGYPPGLISDVMLDTYYDSVKVSRSYLEMYTSAARVTFQNSFHANSSLWFYGRERYIFLGDVLQWTERRSPRPFYDVRRNTFILPSGVLRPPYYNNNGAIALNFGGLGFLVAYDLLRALLSNRTDTFWGRLVSQTSISKRCRCLESRIATEAPGIPSHGLATTALAIRLAFTAYQQREDIADDEALSGLESMSPEQLFFVAVARTLCSVARDEHYVKVVLQRVMVAALAQVDAALMWLPEFQDAFNCSQIGSHHQVTLLRDEQGC